MASTAEDRLAIDEDLNELELDIKRLRIEYEQFFRGAMKREPSVLRGKIQKTISSFMQTPPRNAMQKFRFNSLNARYQSFRQMWGRTMRQMEEGTYRQHQFKLKRKEEEERAARELEALQREQDALSVRRSAARPADAAKPQAQAQAPAPASGLDRLAEALRTARQKTGESDAGVTRERLAAIVKKQTEAIRAARGSDVKVKFKVVIEDNRAKLKATVE
jgi:hypothetical protein